MRYIVLIALIALTACKPATKSGENEWIQLFNGKDLEGWDIKFTGHMISNKIRRIDVRSQI